MSDAFAADPGKHAQWQAFARNLSASMPGLDEVVVDLRLSLSVLFNPP